MTVAFINHMRRAALLASILVMAMGTAPARAVEEAIRIPYGGVVVFGAPGATEALAGITMDSVNEVKRVFDACGRFPVVENSQVEWAIGKVRESGTEDDTIYRKTAARLNADIYVLVSVVQQGKVYFAEMRLVPLREGTLRPLATVVKSALAPNVSRKIAREAARAHAHSALRVSVIKSDGDGTHCIDAGQWNGLEEKEYTVQGGGRITVLRTGRTESVARIAGVRDLDEPLVIDLYPPVEKITRAIDERIREDTIRRYDLGATLLKEGDSRQRFMEGMCVINPAGNICLPVYGSYLATHYLGFSETGPDVYGLVFSAVMLANNLVLTEFITGFRTNFFPWVRDDDKTMAMQNLQICMWATIPLTVTAAYLDQLAYLCQKSEVLPPFFDDRDAFSSVLSLVAPGGGFFYKGQRIAGWSMYAAEMTVAACGAYYAKKGKAALYLFPALGLLKVLDIAGAYFIRPAYRHFEFETASAYDAPTCSFVMYPTTTGDIVYAATISLRF